MPSFFRTPQGMPLGLCLILVLTPGPGTTSRAASGPSASESSATRLTINGNAPAGFELLPPAQTGITFTNLLSDRASAANRVLENGSGVAVGDFDSDGRPDLFFCGLSGNSTLYRNLGAWRFSNVTASAGLHLTNDVCRGAVFADLDGDRRLDLLISTLSRGVLCWRNEGGYFRERTTEAGTGGPPGSTTLALADVDGNGTLDLYVTRYRAEDIRDSSLVEARQVSGRTELHPKYANRLVVGPNGLIEFGEPDQLYLNDGRARFTPLAWTLGNFRDEEGRTLEVAPRDWGLTAAFRDLNGDGLPDLYVCNDYWTPDRLWLNTGQGNFRLSPAAALRHTSENSMGVDVADIDRDGNVDLLVLDMLDPDSRVRRRQALAQTTMTAAPGEILNRPQVMQNTLFRGRGDGTFAEIAEFAGIARSGWSWQPLFLDVDLDGLEDVIIPAGHRRDVQDLDATERIRQLQHPWGSLRDPRARQEAFERELMEHARLYPGLESPVVAFRNLGGCRFTNVTEAWGLSAAGVHQGTALADLDGDGDLDVVVNNLNSAAGLYRNRSTAPRVAVRLRGQPPNSEGIGARVTLLDGAVPSQSQEMVSGGRYLSGSETLLTFAAGTGTRPMTLEVRWRSGRRTTLTGILPNHGYAVDEPTAAASSPSASPHPKRPLFEDWSARLPHRHHQVAPRDGTASQPLLSRELTRRGPGLAFVDLDGNPWPDLLIGTGAGGRLTVFTNTGLGGFAEAPSVPAPFTATSDLSGVVAIREPAATLEQRSPNTTSVRPSSLGPVATRAYIGSLTPLDPPASASIHELLLSPGRQTHTPQAGRGSVGPLALGDLDGDGELERFAGGSAIPGRYPEASPSHLYRRRQGTWQIDPLDDETLKTLGVVNGAVFGDLDGDGRNELIVSGDWSPIRVFRQVGERLTEVTRDWGLDAWTGWWLGITLGDLDADGRLDIVAGNWGLNSFVSASPDRPAVLIQSDFLERGTVDLIEGEWDARRGILVPRHRLNELQTLLPTLRDRFPTHRSYVQASLDDVVKAFGRPVRRFEARTLESSIFWNRGTRFVREPLPDAAQYSPAFGVLVSDFDGDGHEDVVMTQNCFAVAPGIPRLDAGRGLLLRGTGTGRLESIDPSNSGIQIDGEQRGAAFADIDLDGRLDLVITQNGASTRLLHNVGAAAGIRVRLDAGARNPDGVGCGVRVVTPSQAGPVRPVLAGSGWWSQSSPVLVFARPPSGSRISVLWTSGEHTIEDIPPGATELTVRRLR